MRLEAMERRGDAQTTGPGVLGTSRMRISEWRRVAVGPSAVSSLLWGNSDKEAWWSRRRSAVGTKRNHVTILRAMAGTEAQTNADVVAP